MAMAGYMEQGAWHLTVFHIHKHRAGVVAPAAYGGNGGDSPASVNHGNPLNLADSLKPSVLSENDG